MPTTISETNNPPESLLPRRKGTLRLRRLSRIGLGVIALVLVACSFGVIRGRFDTTWSSAVGVFAINEEGSRLYVGQVSTGDAFDASVRLAAVNASTGVEMGSIAAANGGANLRAVATDPATDRVYTLHESGDVRQWPIDLGAAISTTSAVFSAPTGFTRTRFCDFEIFPNGHWIATGLAAQGNQRIAFMHYSYPHPQRPGERYGEHIFWNVAAHPDARIAVSRLCPRIADDESNGQLVVLSPRDNANGTVRHTVHRYEQFQWDLPGYWGLNYVSTFTIPQDIKEMPCEISAQTGVVVTLADYLWGNGSPAGRFQLFEATGAALDEEMIEVGRGIDMLQRIARITQPRIDDPLRTFPSNTPSLQPAVRSIAYPELWWSGFDLASTKELGTVELLR